MTKVIILDIEGTTTPISFVHDTLFTYSMARIGGFVMDNFEELKFEIEQLVEENSNDPMYEADLMPDSANSVSDYLKFLIEQDRKSTPLKSIQGMIWKTGYDSGEIVSPVFDDVPPAFKRWKDAGKRIGIYSSGSVLAQKLLFRHTEHGDLTPLIARYFDTTIGGKREVSSYAAIAEQLGVEPHEVLFVSDVPAELDAARSAGMNTALSIRPGNAPISNYAGHRMIRTFAELE
ncbi:MAG: acireductone synthase [Pyrinomonadaceae bacterium]